MNSVSAYLSSSIECFNKTVSANFPISKNRLCIASSVSLIVGALGLVLMKKIPATSGLLVTLVGSNLLTQMQLSECNGKIRSIFQNATNFRESSLDPSMNARLSQLQESISSGLQAADENVAILAQNHQILRKDVEEKEEASKSAYRDLQQEVENLSQKLQIVASLDENFQILQSAMKEKESAFISAHTGFKEEIERLKATILDLERSLNGQQNVATDLFERAQASVSELKAEQVGLSSKLLSLETALRALEPCSQRMDQLEQNFQQLTRPSPAQQFQQVARSLPSSRGRY
jgi:chromosome segregation ATPase